MISSLLVVYLSGVLKSINTLAFGVFTALTFLGIFYAFSSEAGQIELIDKNKKFLIKLYIISLLCSILVPTNLDTKVLDAYITENSKLRKEAWEMKQVIHNNNLEYELNKVIREELK